MKKLCWILLKNYVLKSIVFSAIPHLNGESSLFVLSQSTVRVLKSDKHPDKKRTLCCFIFEDKKFTATVLVRLLCCENSVYKSIDKTSMA